jgi:hypothetical protein
LDSVNQKPFTVRSRYCRPRDSEQQRVHGTGAAWAFAVAKIVFPTGAGVNQYVIDIDLNDIIVAAVNEFHPDLKGVGYTPVQPSGNNA